MRCFRAGSLEYTKLHNAVSRQNNPSGVPFTEGVRLESSEIDTMTVVRIIIVLLIDLLAVASIRNGSDSRYKPSFFKKSGFLSEVGDCMDFVCAACTLQCSFFTLQPSECVYCC